MKLEDLPIIFYIGPAAAKKTWKAPQTQIGNFFREVINVTRHNLIDAKRQEIHDARRLIDMNYRAGPSNQSHFSDTGGPTTLSGKLFSF